MPDYILSKASQKGKRFQVKTPEGKTIAFGSDVGSTFIDHQDATKKKAWEARHKKGNPSAWNNKNSPLWWARVILWSQPTLKGAINHVRNKYGIHIKRGQQ